jgi:tetratricopeptide (TPR) repeat protein
MDFEERIFLLWKKYRRVIGGLIVVFFTLFIGYQSVGYIAERREDGVREAYRLVRDADSRLAFAEDHAGHPLAGLAYLELAGEKYEAGAFAEAAAHYQSAIVPLVASLLSGRAKLGYAMASIQSENIDLGEQTLRNLVDDVSQLDGIRAEAAYHLAILHWSRGKFAEVKKHLERIEELERPGFWMTKAGHLLATVPELRILEEEATM